MAQGRFLLDTVTDPREGARRGGSREQASQPAGRGYLHLFCTGFFLLFFCKGLPALSLSPSLPPSLALLSLCPLAESLQWVGWDCDDQSQD